MRLDFATTMIQAVVTREREALDSAYERLPDSTQYWGMVDLADSANYRIARGPREGYVRGATFLALVRQVVLPCTEVRLLKELGDAVLLSAANLRPLFEFVVVLDQVAHQVAAIAGTNEFPFAVRSGIGFGPVKRLVREHEDYLGHAIDRLSRLMGVRSRTATVLIDDEAVRAGGEMLGEYHEFLSLSESVMAPSEATKQMSRPVFYREVRINRQALLAFERHFVPWREGARTTSREA